jgi:hypothetical protein
MTARAETFVAFSGPVECHRDESAPIRLTLIGASSDGSERVILGLEGRAPADLPATLAAPTVQRIAPREYAITSGERSWVVTATRAHLHRDVSAAFYAAVPPRRVPWHKRTLWNVGLAFAASPLGRRWLRR